MSKFSLIKTCSFICHITGLYQPNEANCDTRFPKPFLSLTEQFVVGAGKQSKQNPTESRECNLPAFFYRLFASLHCRNTPCPCPPPPPYPQKKNCLRIVFYLRLCEGANVTRNDSQRWFSPHHSAVTILRHCLQLFHNCSNTVGLNY